MFVWHFEKIFDSEASLLQIVETAKEAERGIVEVETLKHTNKQLIETLDEVKTIHEEGRAKRRAAENELARIESELKAKLLEVR